MIANTSLGRLSFLAEGSGAAPLSASLVLNGIIKRAQLTFLYIGKLLNEVRAKKKWQALKHPDIEDYAEKRLHLRRSSLYSYLQICDWVAKNHPEWLQPKVKGFIPDMTDVADLMWIESELQHKNIPTARRAALEALRDKALKGDLKHSEVLRFRKKTPTDDEAIESFLKRLRLLRQRGSQLKKMPAEVIANLDTAIGILANDQPLKVFAGLSPTL